MRSAVVFAAYIDDAAYFPMFDKNMEIFRSEMRECRFYVGINPCRQQDAIIARFERAGLDFQARIVPDALALQTDASAYQAALSLLRADGADCDLVWFSHTKGATSRTYGDLSAQLIELYLKSETVRDFFMSHAQHGLYATSGTVYPKKRGLIEKYCAMRYPCLLLTPLYSCYVLRGNLVRFFLRHCVEEFFTQRLPSGHFFEFDFPQIAFQQGYLPYVQQVVQVHHAELATVKSTEKNYYAVLRKWITTNRINDASSPCRVL